MTAIGITTARVARSRRLSLSEVLGTHGIQTMPRDWATEHKAVFLKETRAAGYGPRTTLALLFVRRLLLALSFLFLPRMAEREHKAIGRIVGRVYGNILAFVPILGGGLAYFLNPWFGLMALVTMFSLAAVVFETTRRLSGMNLLAFSTSWWDTKRLRSEEDLRDLPPTLQKRVARVSAIPGVRVYEETLDDDPLVYAARGWGPFKEICYLGGYATGVERIDSF